MCRDSEAWVDKDISSSSPLGFLLLPKTLLFAGRELSSVGFLDLRGSL